MGRGKAQATLELIDAARDILQSIQPASVRAVCYQLFIAKLLPSMGKRDTSRVSRHLVYAREHALVPWEWLVDTTRALDRPYAWDSPEAYIRDILNAYRPNRWAEQPARIEVWSEKNTVAGTLAPVLQAYGVGFQVLHGFDGASTLHESAVRSAMDPRPLTVLYLGDWDPSGMYMSEEDLPRRLTRYEGHVQLIRLALTPDDIDPSAGVPSFPVTDKLKDTRTPWFRRVYGEACWELDALSPPVLRARVEAAIRSRIAWPSWERFAATEAAEKHCMTTHLAAWNQAHTQLVGS